MRKRADDVADTRLRIVEAAMRLHGTVGPAATTIAGIAAAAGVTRVTVYRHFTDDDALFTACSAHWREGQALPDPQRWSEIADPHARLLAGLTDLYRFYRAGAPMLRLIHRDLDAIPEAQRHGLVETDAHHRDVLLAPWRTRGARRRRTSAVIGHAVSFGTWHSLCAEQGLSDREAADAMVVMVAATACPP
jgi:AcrR family transcriptional regulator